MENGIEIQFTLLVVLLAAIAWLHLWTFWHKMKRGEAVDVISHLLQKAGVSNIIRTHETPADGYIADGEPVEGTNALANPPHSLVVTLQAIERDWGADPYLVPLGWDTGGSVAVSLWGDVYHSIITGQSGGGKDNMALNIMLALALKNTPDRVRFCIIDGKGLDFVGFESKAHTFALALDPEAIGPAMQALTKERERRGTVLRTAKVSKWESYKGNDIPMLVVYISELSLLEDAVGSKQLESWLNSELAAGRAFGMRYIIATQTVSNFGTRWRSQVSLYIAGFQPSSSQDKPNTGLTTNEILQVQGTPPSLLPVPPVGAGVFTCVQGRQAVTLKSGLMSDEQRESLLDTLPDQLNGSLNGAERSGSFNAVQPRSERGSEAFSDIQKPTKNELMLTLQTVERVQDGSGKAAAIETVWGAKKGGSDQYKRAKALLELALTGELDLPTEENLGPFEALLG